VSIPTIADYRMPDPQSFPEPRTPWHLDARRAVLLMHDVQRYFLRFYGGDSALIAQLVDNLARLRAWARSHGVPVVYTMQPHEQSSEQRALLNDVWGPGLTRAEPSLEQVVERLLPEAGDTVLTKWRYSAFQRSELEALMKTWKRDQLVIGGVYAHIGCLVTAVDAFMRDIQPFLVGDAVADFSEAEHRMALDWVAKRCGCVIASEQLAVANVATASRQWLHARIRALIEDESEIDPNENLIFYGLDSLQVMKVASELKQVGIRVSFDELARVPTMNAWWSLIEQKRSTS
jgi:bifunctional isochorismate lyase/aryl carrier protein